MKRSSRILVGLIAVGALLGVSRPVSAASITFVDAGRGQAEFVTGAGTLTITLMDLVEDPRSAADNISGFGFGFDISPSSGASFTSGFGISRTIAGDGTYTDGDTVSLLGPWMLGSHVGDDVFIDALGGGQPKYTIVGLPGAGNLYSNAKGSLAGNGPHNPFVGLSATFVLSIPNVTSDTLVTHSLFRFGTGASKGFEAGSCTSGCTSSDAIPQEVAPVPEPTTLVLLGTGLVGVASQLRRRPKINR